jgi:hypothetical protein
MFCVTDNLALSLQRRDQRIASLGTAEVKAPKSIGAIVGIVRG